MLGETSVCAACQGDVSITRLSVPRAVRNGSEESVVLDCEYEVAPDEAQGLALKWFLNEDPQPLYQWIPGLGRRAVSARLQGRVNLDYTVSPHTPITKFRALNLLRPTTDLGGVYTCHVSSLHGVDHMSQQMVVYAPPSYGLEFNYTRLGRGRTRLQCGAEGTHPAPRLSLAWLSPEGSRPLAVTADRALLDHEVQLPDQLSELQCTLAIPGTDFALEKRLVYYPACQGDVSITRLSVPRAVRNGSEESVVLDCEYEVAPDEAQGLALKWFLNEDPQPLYQWIPGLGRRAVSARLQGRVNLDYTVSPHTPITKFRALNLLRPTTDLGGVYTCHVSSLHGVDHMSQQMVVYAPPSYGLEFNYTRLGRGRTRLQCGAEGTHPAPRLSLAWLSPEGSRPLAVTADRALLDHEVQLPDQLSELQCTLAIPGTDFALEKRLVYYPG
ncbi:hypothetical protein LAZ67_22002403 [Cordylochernes scorpioides]|uniref:Immunoglobulin domain-containing protein n=1 Tax=Cordylochernes scorpioides TaxID=51811 RepID=A0ABY6LQK3_9ARAC|nr:hypothetical protein LAZ67_22002403 [Cordylochernes scorpioides]